MEAQAAADQMMMHGAGGEQRRNRCGRAGRPVRQDDDVLASAHGSFGALAQFVERLAHAGCAVIGAMGHVERDGAELIVGDVADAADALQVLVGEDRMLG